MPWLPRTTGEDASESRTTSGFVESHEGRRESSGACIRGPQACEKELKGIDDGAGCSSAVVASDRVSCRGGSDGLRGRLASCVLVADMKGALEVLRDRAGQSHGSVNWSESVVGDLKASLRSFRPAARASISKIVYGGIKRE